MIEKRHPIVLGFILLCVVLSGCFSVKPAGTGSASNQIQTFYVGKDGTQYFIKPTKFKSCEKNQGEISVDFTFRIKTDLTESDSVLVNFSVRADQVLKNADELKFSSGGHTLSIEAPELLFSEFSKGQYHSRYGGKADLASLRKLFSSESWTLTYLEDEVKLDYCPTRKAKRTIRAANHQVFSIFDP